MATPGLFVLPTDSPSTSDWVIFFAVLAIVGPIVVGLAFRLNTEVASGGQAERIVKAIQQVLGSPANEL